MLAVTAEQAGAQTAPLSSRGNSPASFTGSKIRAAPLKRPLIWILHARKSRNGGRKSFPAERLCSSPLLRTTNFFGRGWVGAAPLDTGVPKMLVENAYFGRFLPGGYLAYVSQGTVFVVPFDVQKLKITGTAIPVLQGVDSDITNGSAQLSFADNGTAIYLSGAGVSHDLNVVLLDRKGAATVLMSDRQDAASPRFSPDGKRFAFQSASSIWVHDFARGTTSAVISGTAAANFPIWTPDGQRLTYWHPVSGGQGSGQAIFWKRADGTGEEEALTSKSLPI